MHRTHRSRAFKEKGKVIMASLAHPSQQYIEVRHDIAVQGHQHMEFTLEMLARLGRWVTALVGPTLKRWAVAHQQRVQDRLFWELALRDPRVMSELRAMKDRAGA
jgi:hypothetical protein